MGAENQQHALLSHLHHVLLSCIPQRYFVLEEGILKYATTRQDVSTALIGVN